MAIFVGGAAAPVAASLTGQVQVASAWPFLAGAVSTQLKEKQLAKPFGPMLAQVCARAGRLFHVGACGILICSAKRDQTIVLSPSGGAHTPWAPGAALRGMFPEPGFAEELPLRIGHVHDAAGKDASVLPVEFASDADSVTEMVVFNSVQLAAAHSA